MDVEKEQLIEQQTACIYHTTQQRVHDRENDMIKLFV